MIMTVRGSPAQGLGSLAEESGAGLGGVADLQAIQELGLLDPVVLHAKGTDQNRATGSQQLGHQTLLLAESGGPGPATGQDGAIVQEDRDRVTENLLLSGEGQGHSESVRLIGGEVDEQRIMLVGEGGRQEPGAEPWL